MSNFRYDCPSVKPESLDKMFNDFKSKKVRFLLFFSADKSKSDPMVHNGMKLMEQKFNICTQHVTQKIMKKALGQLGGGQQMVLDNILQKVFLFQNMNKQFFNFKSSGK
jgi:hypothetical protein